MESGVCNYHLPKMYKSLKDIQSTEFCFDILCNFKFTGNIFLLKGILLDNSSCSNSDYLLNKSYIDRHKVGTSRLQYKTQLDIGGISLAHILSTFHDNAFFDTQYCLLWIKKLL